METGHGNWFLILGTFSKLGELDHSFLKNTAFYWGQKNKVHRLPLVLSN